MLARTLTIAWTVMAVTPIAALLNGKEDFALGIGIVYLIGWWVLRTAIKRDPECDVLRGFFCHRRVSTVGAVLIFVTVQLAMFASPRAGLGILLVAAFFLFVLWARSKSTEILALKTGRLILILGTLFFCIFAAEAALRVTTAFRPRNSSGWTWGHRVVNNELGFREREFEVPKPDNTFRIMVLGDSLTWGAGLADEERYSRLLEDRLRKSHPQHKIEVLNFAYSGSPTILERDVLLTHMGRVQPELVIVGFCVNDPQPKSENYAVELEKYRVLFKSYHALGKHLGATHLANFLHLRTDQLLRNTGLVPDSLVALDRAYNVDSEEWRQFTEALADIKKLCDLQELPPPLFAPLFQGNGDYNHPNEALSYFLKWHRQAGDAARAAGFVVVDMEDEFKKQGDKNRAVNPWDGHPSAECNVVYAENLSRAVSRLLAELPSSVASSAEDSSKHR